MGCNCKSNQIILKTKKAFGDKPETKSEVPIMTKVKMGVQAVGIWTIIILGSPIIVPILIVRAIKHKPIKISKLKLKIL